MISVIGNVILCRVIDYPFKDIIQTHWLFSEPLFYLICLLLITHVVSPLKKVLICLADQCVSVLPFCSHSQDLGCCSTLMACLSEGGCQSLRQQKHLRSWSTLRDSLWCQSFLSQMQGIASDKQKRTSSLTYWECLWVLNSCASNGVKGVSPALWCVHAVHSKLFQFPLI